MHASSIAIVVAGLLTTAASVAAQGTVPYDHVHLAVVDPEKAEARYTANLDGHVGENSEATGCTDNPRRTPTRYQPRMAQLGFRFTY